MNMESEKQLDTVEVEYSGRTLDNTGSLGLATIYGTEALRRYPDIDYRFRTWFTLWDDVVEELENKDIELYEGGPELLESVRDMRNFCQKVHNGYNPDQSEVNEYIELGDRISEIIHQN